MQITQIHPSLSTQQIKVLNQSHQAAPFFILIDTDWHKLLNPPSPSLSRGGLCCTRQHSIVDERKPTTRSSSLKRKGKRSGLARTVLGNIRAQKEGPSGWLQPAAAPNTVMPGKLILQMKFAVTRAGFPFSRYFCKSRWSRIFSCSGNEVAFKMYIWNF